MAIHIPDDRPTDSRRQIADAQAENREAKLYSRNETPLSKRLTDFQEALLLEYVVSRWFTLHGALSSWRVKMQRFEKMADDDYSDRKGAPNPEQSDAARTIFDRQNHTLGVVSGFADFAHAQARDDIFGVRPWFSATPVGASDTELAERVTKHSQWKFDQSNLEVAFEDAVRLACDLGTTFVKIRWCKEIEVSESMAMIAVSKSTGEPVLDFSGDYIQAPEPAEGEQPEADPTAFPPDTDFADIEWEERRIQNSLPVYDNIDACNLDWKAIAFEPTAPELDLRFTDFFTRFSMGLHDLCAAYSLSPDQKRELLALATSDASQEPRDHRDETDTARVDPMRSQAEANPEIHLVEGFIRFDPANTGQPVRIHVIFSPQLHVMFRCDYLANVTPGGLLPVFPVRCFKTPRRIIGRGYHERFEDANTAIDQKFNCMTYRDRFSAHVITGMHLSALENRGQGQDLVLNPEKPFQLAEDKTLKDLIEFAVAPDTNNRTDSLMQEMLQMSQMRTGITSAAQGEMKGVPNASTATGVNQMMSRGAILLKWPIDQMSSDIEPAAEFAVHLHYANLDHDETITVGEGKDAELIEIKKNDVRGLRANVKLTLTRAQSMTALQSAQGAIAILQSYAALPESEKSSQRRLYVQAVQSLGFNDAERIVRDAVVDPAGIAALLPPELQPAFNAWLQAQGLAQPAAPGEPAAPGPESAPAAPDAPVTGPPVS